jgi:hypothetical protein
VEVFFFLRGVWKFFFSCVECGSNLRYSVITEFACRKGFASYLGEKMVARPRSTVSSMGGPYAIRCSGSPPAREPSPLASTSPSESMMPPFVLLPTRIPGSIRIAFTCRLQQGSETAMHAICFFFSSSCAGIHRMSFQQS